MPNLLQLTYFAGFMNMLHQFTVPHRLHVYEYDICKVCKFTYAVFFPNVIKMLVCRCKKCLVNSQKGILCSRQYQIYLVRNRVYKADNTKSKCYLQGYEYPRFQIVEFENKGICLAFSICPNFCRQFIFFHFPFSYCLNPIKLFVCFE